MKAAVMPKIFCSCGGLFSWSEKLTSELSDSEIKSIWSFCINSGFSNGWISLVKKEPIHNPASVCPFTPTMLDGGPYKKWIESFMDGAEQAKLNQQ